MKKEDHRLTVEKHILSCFDGSHHSPPLYSLCNDLLVNQQTAWSDLKLGYANLQASRTRRLECEHFSLYLQFNPGRAHSTFADTDPVTIQNRKCFLCAQNLPAEQKAIEYRRHYLILCNPYPIFPGHLTIPHLEHRPQALETGFATLLRLAEDLGSRYLVFYNGPKCGASLPDHMHFQASPQGALPIERDILDTGRRYRRKRIGDIELTRFYDLGRAVLMLEGESPAAMEGFMTKFCHLAKQSLQSSAEPMMNMFCSYSGSSWRLVVFLRRKHRPDAYFLEGKDRIMITPGLVDMTGLMITPREEDFNNVDAASAQSILQEVSLEEDRVEEIISRL